MAQVFRTTDFSLSRGGPGIRFDNHFYNGYESIPLRLDWRQAQRLRRRSCVPSRVHAQMPDTMYASTPDPAPPLHAAHAGALDVSANLSLLRSDSSASARSEGDVEHGIAYFLSALRWRQLGLQGVARVINRSGEAGEVRIDAWDDAGVHHGPATLAIGAGESVQFNSLHLESGYAARGLSDGIGYPKHVHKALRRYFGIERSAGALRFPFNNTEDFAFFG